MIDLLGLQRYEVYEFGEKEDPVGRYVLASDCEALCSELSAARERLKVVEGLKYPLKCLAVNTEGENRAFVEVMSIHLGFGHACDITIPAPPAELLEPERPDK